MKRRTTLLITFLISVITCGILYSYFSYSDTSSETRFVRSNVNSTKGQSDLEAMNTALSIMREKGCTDPMSWYYQGAMHWIPDSIGKNPLCESYSTVADLKEAWDNCTHSPSGKEKIHFLVWHRLYIWHFEKIVRKLSGKKDFALPYWSYTNNNLTDRTLPAILRNPNSSLYESCRFDSLNNGYPISGEIERALDMTKLMSYTDYKTFCLNMNAAPHGAMHDYIGAGNDTTGLLKFNNPITGTITNTGLMGWVPTAGFDPVFWLHHSNIDRLWQQWTNSPNGKMITLEELKSVEWPYVFFDENGKKVEYTMEQVIDIIYDMDYDFDDTKVYSKEKPLLTNGAQSKTLFSHNANAKVNNGLTKIKVENHLLKSSNTTFSKMNMEVSVSFNKVPRGVYEVYLNVPSNEMPHPSSRYFVGFMNFFGYDSKMQGKSCRKGCCTPLNTNGRPYTNFYYELSKESVASGEYNVTIYKHNQVSSDMIIDNITVTGR
jgi:hypothetical protein